MHRAYRLARFRTIRTRSQQRDRSVTPPLRCIFLMHRFARALPTTHWGSCKMPDYARFCFDHIGKGRPEGTAKLASLNVEVLITCGKRFHVMLASSPANG